MRVGLREEEEEAGTSTDEDTSTQLSPCFILVFLHRASQTLPQDVQPPSAPLTSSRSHPYFSHCKRGCYLPGQLTFSRPHASDEEELVFVLFYRLSKHSGLFFLLGWILNDEGQWLCLWKRGYALWFFSWEKWKHERLSERAVSEQKTNLIFTYFTICLFLLLWLFFARGKPNLEYRQNEII